MIFRLVHTSGVNTGFIAIEVDPAQKKWSCPNLTLKEEIEGGIRIPLYARYGDFENREVVPLPGEKSSQVEFELFVKALKLYQRTELCKSGLECEEITSV